MIKYENRALINKNKIPGGAKVIGSIKYSDRWVVTYFWRDGKMFKVDNNRYYPVPVELDLLEKLGVVKFFEL